MKNIFERKIFADGLDVLINMIEHDEDEFLEYAMSTVLYINPSDVENEWYSLLQSIRNKNPLYIRHSKTLFGEESRTNAHKRTFEHPRRHPLFPETVVIVDPNNNHNAKQAFSKMSGIPTKTLKNYTLTHVWGKTDNPYAFCSGWNIAMTPSFLAALTEEKKHLGDAHISSKFKNLFRAIAYELYQNIDNGEWIKFCEIDQPARNDSEHARKLLADGKVNILKSQKQKDNDVEKCKNQKIQQELDLSEEADLSIGRLVEKSIHGLIEKKILSEAHINFLVDKEFCKKTLRINYPLFKEVDETQPFAAQKNVKNRPRYFAKPVRVGDKNYLICNDLYEKNRKPYLEWLDSLK